MDRSAPPGKARVARNALRHGLRVSSTALLDDESPEEFEALASLLTRDIAPGPVGERGPNPFPALAPEGGLQSLLTRRLVIAAWRLERADRIETEVFSVQGDLDDRYDRLGMALVRDGHGPRAFDTLLRYRGSAMAELWRSLRALKAVQAEAGNSTTERPNKPESRGNPGLAEHHAGQPERDLRHEHHQHEAQDLQADERPDRAKDLLEGDVGRRHALQPETGRAERRRQEVRTRTP